MVYMSLKLVKCVFGTNIIILYLAAVINNSYWDAVYAVYVVYAVYAVYPIALNRLYGGIAFAQYKNALNAGLFQSD